MAFICCISKLRWQIIIIDIKSVKVIYKRETKMMVSLIFYVFLNNVTVCIENLFHKGYYK